MTQWTNISSEWVNSTSEWIDIQVIVIIYSALTFIAKSRVNYFEAISKAGFFEAINRTDYISIL